MKRILLIDDDLAFSEMLSEILKDEGFDVLVEHDGLRGYERATAEHPDLVMCDVMMPGMSGIEMVTKLREDTWGKAVPIILLTNMTQPEAMAQMQEGAAHTECLLKTDWTLEKLAEKLKTLLA